MRRLPPQLAVVRSDSAVKLGFGSLPMSASPFPQPSTEPPSRQRLRSVVSSTPIGEPPSVVTTLDIGDNLHGATANPWDR